MQPLSLKLNDADLSSPCLIEGKHPVVIDKADVTPSKSGKGSFLHIQCKTLEPTQSDKGKTLNAGYPIGTRLMLPIPGTEFGDGGNAESYTRQLGLFMLAVANLKNNEENKAKLPEFNEDYILSLPTVTLMANVKNETTDEYGKQSVIKSFAAVG
jgi:hypothetical protein